MNLLTVFPSKNVILEKIRSDFFQSYIFAGKDSNFEQNFQRISQTTLKKQTSQTWQVKKESFIVYGTFVNFEDSTFEPSEPFFFVPSKIIPGYSNKVRRVSSTPNILKIFPGSSLNTGTRYQENSM